MPSALVLAGPRDHRDFVSNTLRAKGWSVTTPDVNAKAPIQVEGVDLILADLGFAIAQEWLNPARPAALPAPLIVMSRFAVFLEKIAPLVASTIHIPPTEDAILGAVDEALDVTLIASHPPVAAAASPPDPIDNPARDAIIATRILNQVDLDAELSSIASLVARSVGVSMGVVSIVSSKVQSFLGHTGMPDDFAAAGGTVRSWSFCQHVVREGAPLIVDDARAFPVLKDTPLVTMGLVSAYAGHPIEVDGIGAVGAVCALSSEPHPFSETDRVTIELGARLVGEVFSRRARVSNPDPAPPDPPPPPPPQDDLRLIVGELLDDKYWITAALGRGGQSRVYLARDRMFGQLVAIKVNPRHFEPMLIREGETLATLRHPNIVQLHGWGRTPSGEIYVVLEYVAGETLQARVEEVAAGDRIPVARVAEIVEQIAGALASMHALGYVHGDVKPLNILLDPRLDRAVLIDFGLGFALNRLSDPTWPLIGGGTAGYSAPEQFAGGKRLTPSPAYDIYALAGVAFAMLAGAGPFEGSMDEQLERQRVGNFTSLSSLRPELSPKVEAVIERALSPDPAARPESVLAFSEELRRALSERAGRRAPSSPPSPSPAPRSRGEVFTSVRGEVHRLMGPAVELRTFAKLTPAEREVFTQATEPSKLYPAGPLVAYLRAFAEGDLTRLRPVSAGLAGDALRAAVRKLRIVWTPETLLSVAPALLRRFHAWGHVDVKRPASNAARIEVSVPEGFAPVMCWHLTYLLEALVGATCKQSEVTQSSCVAAGAPACVVDVRWADGEGVRSRRDPA